MTDDWYQPLLDRLWSHLLTHKDMVELDHATEYQLTEEFLYYEEFRDGESRSLPCPYVDCEFCIKYVPTIILETWETNDDL